jgi:hypothetical protein
MLALVALLGSLRLKSDSSWAGVSDRLFSRQVIWASLWSICTSFSALQPAPTWPFAILSVVFWFSDYLCVWLTSGEDTRTSCYSLFWFLPPVQALVAFCFAMMSSARKAATPPQAMSILPSYPKTGSNLADLDQWYPLAYSLFLVTVPLCRRTYKLLTQRLEPVSLA